MRQDSFVRVRVWVGGIALVLAAASCTQQSRVADESPSDAPETQSLPLPARWWIWNEAFPPESNPVQDATGERCSGHQPADVWFLAGTYGGAAKRHCQIPSGRPIYFPVLNQICSVAPGEGVADALAGCAPQVDLTTASLDGKPLKVTEATSEQAFAFTANAGSSTGFPPGEQEVVAWGRWVGPLTLPDGASTLRFRGAAGDFALDVTYELRVG